VIEFRSLTEEPTGWFFGVFFHGILDGIMEDDRAVVDCRETAESIPEGISAVIVKSKYEAYDALLYFWHKDGYPHGLIVNPNDEDSVEYAELCLKERMDIL